jgi:hypothetical protein
MPVCWNCLAYLYLREADGTTDVRLTSWCKIMEECTVVFEEFAAVRISVVFL